MRSFDIVQNVILLVGAFLLMVALFAMFNDDFVGVFYCCLVGIVILVLNEINNYYHGKR